jgi:predicted AAA+ superfamily ATPase
MIEGDDLFTEYKGALTENYVASELASQGVTPLAYWTSGGLAEVDFVVEHDGRPLPLEVKSGSIRGAKSLRVFAQTVKPPRLYRTSPRNFTLVNDFANIPLYAIGCFPRLS